MFKSTKLHLCREHRTVLDPSIALQREEGAREPQKSPEMVSLSGISINNVH